MRWFFEGRRGVLVSRGALVAGLLSVAACDSDSETNRAGSGDGTDGGGAVSGSAGIGGTGAGGAAANGGVGGLGACLPAAPPSGGHVDRAMKLTDIGVANDVDAWCDGNIVVSGRSSDSTAFERRDRTKIEFADAPLWIARYDRDGYALWAKAIQIGAIGTSQPALVRAFPDGSAVLCGMFGTSAVFGAGEANETTLTGSLLPEGYVARYAPDGTLKWAHQIADTDDNYVWGLSAGPEGTTYAVVANNHPGGITLAPGELDFSIGENEGAVVAIDADGHYQHALRYAAPFLEDMRLTTLSNGGALLVGPNFQGFVLGKGSAKESSVAVSDKVFYARLSKDLAVESIHGLPVPSSAFASAGLPDGSVVFVGSFDSSVTLGAGDPNEVTYTTSGQVSGGFVAEYDADGRLAWATELAGDHDVDVYRSAATADGSVWIAGTYALGSAPATSSELVIAPGTAGALKLSTTEPVQFVARLDSSGKPLWVAPFTGTEAPHTVAMTASPVSTIAFGTFGGTGRFGSPPQELTTGDQGVFLALLGP